MEKCKHRPDEEDFFQSFVSTNEKETFTTVLSLGIDAEKLKAFAIEILDDPKSPEDHRMAALLYVDVYKEMIRNEGLARPECKQSQHT